MIFRSEFRILISMCALSTSLVSLAQEGPNPCVQAFQNNVRDIRQEDYKLTVIQNVYRKTCRSSERNFDAGFTSDVKSVIDAVPVLSSFMGSIKAGSNKQFCERFEEGGYEDQQASVTSNTVVTKALDSFNQCMAIWAAQGVAITHKIPSPDIVTFGFNFKNTITNFNLEGVTATGGFTCRAPGPQGIIDMGPYVSLTKMSNFSMTCSREVNKINDGGVDFPPATIVIGTNVQHPYEVYIDQNQILGPSTRAESRRLIEQSQMEIQTLGGRVAELAQENEILKKKVAGVDVRFFNYFYGQHYLVDNNFGAVNLRHFGCGDWTNVNEDIRVARAKSEFCPSADIVRVIKTRDHGGNRCGYHYFVMACVTLGK